jgi:hypothetical protein
MSLALIIIDVSTTERHGYGAKFIFLFLDRLIKKKKKPRWHNEQQTAVFSMRREMAERGARLPWS